MFKPHLRKLQQLVAEGKLRPVLDEQRFDGLEQVADAVEHLQAGRNIGTPVVRLSGAAQRSATVEAAPATPAPSSADGPPVGSMARVRELQDEAFADDVSVEEHMVEWSEARLRAYFEGGGVESC